MRFVESTAYYSKRQVGPLRCYSVRFVHLCLLAPTTTVSETGISLRIKQILHVETEIRDRLLVLLFESQIEQGIVQRSAEEELEREVVDALWSLLSVIDCKSCFSCQACD